MNENNQSDFGAQHSVDLTGKPIAPFRPATDPPPFELKEFEYQHVNEADGSFSVEGPNIPGFYAALARAQSAFQAVVRSRTVTVRPKEGREYTFSYAELDAVLDAVLPALNAEGFSLLQPWHGVGDSQIVRTMLTHECGVLTVKVNLPPAERPGMQAKGGAITYVRRYLCSLLGVAAEDDDDGNAADGNEIQKSERRDRSKPPEHPQSRKQGAALGEKEAAELKQKVEAAGAKKSEADPPAPGELMMIPATGKVIGMRMRELKFNRQNAEDITHRVLGKSAIDSKGDNALTEAEAQKLLLALAKEQVPT